MHVNPGDCRLKLILFVMDFHDGFNWGFLIHLFDVTLNTLLLTVIVLLFCLQASDLQVFGSPTALIGHTGTVNVMVLSTPFSVLVTGSEDGAVIVWDLNRYVSESVIVYLSMVSIPSGVGARCSSVVRAFTHGAMGCRIDPSWGEPTELFLVSASAPRLV